MKRVIIVGLVLMVGLCVRVWAHNPQIATYQVKKINDGWLVEASFPQVAVHSALVKMYGKEKIKSLSEKEYKEKLVAYFKANTIISLNGKKVALGDVALRLGSHQTDLKFLLNASVSSIDKMSFRLEALAENHGQQNVLRVFDGEKKGRFILSEKNSYSVQIAANETGFVALRPSMKIDFFVLAAIMAGVFVLLVFFRFKTFKGTGFLKLSVFIFPFAIMSCGSDDEPVSDFSAEVTISTTDATAKEGDNDASFVVSLDKQNTSGGTINIPITIAGTATAGDDYTEINSVVSIAANQSTVSTTLEVIDDTEEEEEESVTITLGSLPDDITAGSSNSVSISIQDNDATTAETYEVSIEGTTTVSESSSEAIFTVKLDKTNDTGSDIAVSYDIGGTASAGSDYTAPSGTATISNGDSQVYIAIPLVDDADDEEDETIIITLNNTGLPSGVSLSSTNEFTITINDNDAASGSENVTIAFGSTSGNSIEIASWTDIGADSYIIVMSNTDNFTDLSDSDDPDYSDSYNGDGEQVIYNGAAVSSFTVSLLEASSAYYFKVFPFEGGVVDNAQSSQLESTVSCSTSSTTENEVCFDISGDIRTISSNQYPNHTTGSFPNADVTAIALSVTIDLTPETAGSVTYVYDETGAPSPSNKNFYRFGVASNGLGYNPMGLKPWEDPDTGEQNWEWQAKVTDQGETHLDSYGGHVTSDGKYHYHGDIVGLADEDGSRHSRIYGFAADGFPIYYKYGYSDPNDPTSSIVELESSYQLRSGARPGDGTTAPDGTYDGTYIQDYEYINGLGDLDECNGRTGVTPEYPDGTYYYVITSEFPKIPNCFVGTPDIDDFGI